MSYQALYRSWRPQTFSDLVGQPHVKQTLTNAILRNQIAHAYLFSGPRGTGKTSAAKVLARAVNCTNRSTAEPCNECVACRSILEGSSVDVEEIDAASNRGVDEIRQLRDKVQYAPASMQRKVYIIDEVHMLTTEAFNALLKTLEEPPQHTLFVLATTEPHKIPATIISRCQRFDFRRISQEDMVTRLRRVCLDEGFQFEEEALWSISTAADGGLRDALGLLEQTAAFSEEGVTAQSAAHVMGGVQASALLALIQSLVERDLSTVLNLLAQWLSTGKDSQRVVSELLQVLRDLFIVKVSGSNQVKQAQFNKLYEDVAGLCSLEWLLESVKGLGETYMNLRFVDQPRLALEASLLRLVPTAAPPLALSPNVGVRTPASTTAASTSASSSGRTSVMATPPGLVENATAGTAAMATAAEPITGQPTTPQSNAVVDDISVTPVEGRVEPAKADRGQKVQRAASAKRKLEVLQDLHRHSRPDILELVLSKWEDVLQELRKERIQTQAWLMNGTAVLATDDVAVVAFSSRIHREAVMKPDERRVIEAVMARTLGIPLQMMALLNSDWEAFTNGSNEKSHPAQTNLADKVVGVFGADVVEIQDGE